MLHHGDCLRLQIASPKGQIDAGEEAYLGEVQIAIQLLGVDLAKRIGTNQQGGQGSF